MYSTIRIACAQVPVRMAEKVEDSEDVTKVSNFAWNAKLRQRGRPIAFCEKQIAPPELALF